MKRGQAWLSKGIEELAARPAPAFDVVIVGSGYGGAVAAARLSRCHDDSGKRMTVAVLERGLEYAPGSFPARMDEMVAHTRLSGSPADAMSAAGTTGLFDFRLGGDVWALVANGVGGGSLINAGVCEEADWKVLAHPDWPEPWLGNRSRWQELYARARRRLGAEQRWPDGRVPRQAAMKTLAEAHGGHYRTVHLSITPPSAAPLPGGEAGPPVRPCLECGDCFSGCNVGAKLTLSQTYLAAAFRQRCEIYRGATVQRVERRGTGWRVHYRFTDPLLTLGETRDYWVDTRRVVLAAGTYGSTEILLRARAAGLSVSPRLGDGFSANGDLLSAFYDGPHDLGSPPDPARPLQDRLSGPTITSQVSWQQPDPVIGRDYRVRTLQDLGVPGALGWLLGEVLTCMNVPQRWLRFHLRTEQPDDVDPFAVDPQAVRRSLVTVSYLHDGADGRIRPQPGWTHSRSDGALRIDWPGLERLGTIDAEHRRLDALKPPGSNLMRNPLWQFLPDTSVVNQVQRNRTWLTVHPLGGCRMALDSEDGVVDPFGRVFDTGLDLQVEGEPLGERLRLRMEGVERRAVHAGLHVLDGSIVPTSLGINPLLTITALAEGAIDRWIADAGWRELAPEELTADPLALPRADWSPRPPQRTAATALAVRERMFGRLDTPPADHPAEDAGGDKARGADVVSLLVDFAAIGDLQVFLTRPDKSVPLSATIEVRPELSSGVRGVRGDTKPSYVPPRSLVGVVHWMRTERSCLGQRLFRSVPTFVRTRLGADWHEPGGRATDGLWDKIKALTHFGAVRELAYEFEPLDAPWLLRPGDELPTGTRLHGRKRLSYRLDSWADRDSSNPWLQLMEMDLHAELPDGSSRRLARLRFDDAAAIGDYELPLRVVAQENALLATRDLASLGLYFGRVMAGLHMFSFRGPNYAARLQGPRGLDRLPALAYGSDTRYAGLTLERHRVPVDAGTPEDPERLTLCLTRFRPTDPIGPPVLLVHGFGSGGIQYTHRAIEQPLAPWLARQGHDVWVAELRTSIGLSTADRQWSMDEVATEDIPALVRHVLDECGVKQLRVVAHCIGAAMFCMAALAGKLQHMQDRMSMVERLTLMQVGPHVALQRSNRARARVMARLQQMFGLARADSVASQVPSAAEELLDRLLSPLLYPQPQRPYYRFSADALRNAWRTNANRSAAVFGQLFQYENMTDGVFKALEDLLGTCNLTTYAQTAKYAGGERLTDREANDAYVTTPRLKRYFDFPVLLIHGQKNEVFEIRSMRLNEALLLRANVPVRLVQIPGYGHLDCVVGRHADRDVFASIDAFLKLPAPIEPLAGPPIRPIFNGLSGADTRLLAVGPWLGHAEPADGALLLRLGGRLDKLGSDLHAVAVQATTASKPLLLRRPGLNHPVHEFATDYRLPLPAGGETAEVFVVGIHESLPKDVPAEARRKELRLVEEARQAMRAPRAVAALLLHPGWLARMTEPDPADLGLVLACCRQRPLLVDRAMADASMRELRQRLTATGRNGFDALLFAGDQIYADSRNAGTQAGLSDMAFADAYREAWTAPAQRDVMRSRPTYMTIDDHEFRNDYGPPLAQGRPHEYALARRNWLRYQMAAGPAPRRPSDTWRQFEMRGFACFIADTRSDRAEVSGLDRRGATIMSSLQMGDLFRWLRRLQKSGYGERPKLILMSCPIAPWFADAAEPHGELRTDGWQRFPDSIARLLGFIARRKIGNVLFLSGDYHCFADVAITLYAPDGSAIEVRSIVGSGLYSPYPFANAQPSEWLLKLPRQPLPGSRVEWRYKVTRAGRGSGYTQLWIERDGAGWRVHRNFRVVAPGPNDPG